MEFLAMADYLDEAEKYLKTIRDLECSGRDAAQILSLVLLLAHEKGVKEGINEAKQIYQRVP